MKYIRESLWCVMAAALMSAGCGPGRVDVSPYTPVIRAHPSTADSLFNRGIAMEILERIDEAAVLFGEAARLKPDDPDILYELGTNLSIMDNEREAFEAFSRALALRPTHPDHSKLGLAYFSTGNFEKAATELDAAIKASEPHPITLHMRLGRAYQELGRYNEAAASFSTAVQLNPELAAGYYNAWFSIGVCRQLLDRQQEAAEAYLNALRYRPDVPETRFNLGAAYLMLNDPVNAREQCDSLRNYDAAAADRLTEMIRRFGHVSAETGKTGSKTVSPGK